MNKKTIRRIIWPVVLASTIMIVNIGCSLYSAILTIQVYNYGDMHSEFTYDCIPQKGVDLKRMLSEIKAYDQANGTTTEICRKFSKNYLKFWLWLEYTISPYYKFPKC